MQKKFGQFRKSVQTKFFAVNFTPNHGTMDSNYGMKVYFIPNDQKIIEHLNIERVLKLSKS